MRLDQYLVLHHGFTRNKAQQLIANNLVLLNTRVCNKSSTPVSGESLISIVEDRRVEWVSRSAEKLAGFIETLGTRNIVQLPIQDSCCLDVGSSTGGFTQVLLQYGASHVDAVDVGTDQLHPLIRSDDRVHSYEQTDIRHFIKKSETPYDIIVCDASFISLSSIIDPIIAFADSMTYIVLLYKPQFEVGREHLRKTGVPKDPKIVSDKMREFELLLVAKDMKILDLQKSSLIGEAGNQEWIYLLQKN